MNSQKISGIHVFQKAKQVEADLRKVKYLQEMINNKWEDCEQNQGEYNFNKNLPLVEK